MTDPLTLGGTANIQAIDATRFTVAMTGALDGGVFAEVVGSRELDDCRTGLDLLHHAVGRDGSHVVTEDKSIHQPVGGEHRDAQSTYRDFASDSGVLRIEGELR